MNFSYTYVRLVLSFAVRLPQKAAADTRTSFVPAAAFCASSITLFAPFLGSTSKTTVSYFRHIIIFCNSIFHKDPLHKSVSLWNIY